MTESAFGNPFLFSGREWDPELGFYYFRNRNMDPGLGRFVSRDPLGLWGDPLNLGNGYTYAASNPWSLVDPFGLCSGNQNRLQRWGERSYLEEVFAVGKGYFWDPTVGAVVGLGKAIVNYDDTLETAKDTLDFAWNHPEEFSDAVGAAIGEAIENASENPESAGSALSGIVTTVLGGYGAAKGVANAAETTVDLAGDAAKAATRARGLSNTAESVAAPIAQSPPGGLNLFKWGASTTTKSSGWRQGDSMLYLPDRGSPRANWKQNSGRLRQFITKGEPIFDSYRSPSSGIQIPTGGFLRAERNLLESRGWLYDPSSGAYHPTKVLE